MAAEPSINHLLEVASLVTNATEQPDIPALLHGSIEDVGVTKQEILDKFGPEIADSVEEVTDDKSLEKKERKRLQIVNTSKKSPRAALVKLADKVSNLRANSLVPHLHTRELTERARGERS